MKMTPAGGAAATAAPMIRFFRRTPDAARDLRESERRYQRLCELSSDIILDEDLDGRILSINAAGARLCGYLVGDVVGRSIWDLVVPGHVERVRDERRKLLVTGGREIASFDVDLRTADGGTLAVDVRSGLAYSGDTAIGVQTVARNVTEHRRLEARLRQGQKMEAIGRLAGGVAHDFNNILTAMMGYAELALADVGLAHPAAQDLRLILDSGGRAAELVRQLLAFSRRQVLQPVIVQPADVLRAVESLLRPLIGAHITLQTRVPADLGRVRVDPNQLTQVLMNLAVNARDAMPRGGTLTIELGNASVPPDLTRDGVTLVPGHYVVLSVVDTGCGMEERVRANVFEPFFTTKAEGEGTGLGLATVYGIVKQSEGYVFAESEVGQGSRFEVYLPRVAEPLRTTAAEAVPDTPSGTETILVAEDDPDVRSLIVEGLSGFGYRVLSAPDGPRAIAVAKQHLDTIDVLLTDLVMPGLSGPELADHLRALRGDLRVLFMSGNAMQTGSRPSALDGPLIPKPFTPERLARRIRSVLKCG